MFLHTWQLIALALAGWMNRQRQDIVAHLTEDNRVLREHFEGKRVRFADDQRRRPAAKGKTLGRKVLAEVRTLVTPETVLRWYRTLIAKKALCGCQAALTPRQAPTHHCGASIAPKSAPQVWPTDPVEFWDHTGLPGGAPAPILKQELEPPKPLCYLPAVNRQIVRPAKHLTSA